MPEPRLNSAACSVETLHLDVAGACLHAWKVLPTAPRGRYPTVVIAHGWGAVKEMTLDYVAAECAQLGIASIVFDHRGVGGSDGVEGDLDPEQQIADYQAVLSIASEMDDVDSGRLGVWGTSYSGGHVLYVAARDDRVRAVVSQVPTISGSKNTMLRYDAATREEMRRTVAAERAADTPGADLHRVPAIPRAPRAGESLRGSPVPIDPGLLPEVSNARYGNDTPRFYGDLDGPRLLTWRNSVTLRARDRYADYEPGESMTAVSPAPLLVVMADADTITPSDQIYRAFDRVDATGRLLVVEGGHYDVYTSQRERVNAASAAFFAEVLL